MTGGRTWKGIRGGDWVRGGQSRGLEGARGG